MNKLINLSDEIENKRKKLYKIVENSKDNIDEVQKVNMELNDLIVEYTKIAYNTNSTPDK